MLDPGRGGRARSMRLCPATFITCPPVQLISPTSSVTKAQQPFVAPKVPSDFKYFAGSHLVASILKQFNSSIRRKRSNLQLSKILPRITKTNQLKQFGNVCILR
ncbi:hypothetical protein Pint_10678 [Pistacia integerrima]|uniref:Uncharacterized protein n=1 Tax=Pistacia integerrima TaxID=434235 RepID=A0ACC0XFQ4_9ROSI|nr:hypothetical protein Pint_10678 [Pistacia integerrima]